MEDIEDEVEDELFNVEEVSNIVKYTIDTTLGDNNYQSRKVSTKIWRCLQSFNQA